MAARDDFTLGKGQVKNMEHSSEPYIKVSRADIERLVTEVLQLKEFLPKVIPEVVSLYKKLEAADQEVQSCKAENRHLLSECEQSEKQREKLQVDLNNLEKRYDNLLCDYEKAMEDKHQLKVTMSKVSEQLSEQVEYCSGMGAALSTPLWRVSRLEDAVTSILGGSKAKDFLQMTARTVESYFAAYAEEETECHEKSDDFQFVLALCGTITNIAASASGRDFLVQEKHGVALLDTYVSILQDATAGQHSRLKCLIVMALYNVSINRKGLEFVMKKQDFTKLLMRIALEEKDNELKLNAIRLMQSIVMEPVGLTPSVLQPISLPALQELAHKTKGELQAAILELLSDVQLHHADCN